MEGQSSDEERRSSPQIPVLPSGYRETVSDGDIDVLIFYLGCLAQASYIIRDKKAKTAFVIDPRRDVDVYLQELRKNRTRLKGVCLTHVHADFVSGHLELSRRGDADIYMGPGIQGRQGFDITEVRDKDLVDLSERYALQALHTPGHTPESVTWLLVEKESNSSTRPMFAFTGDTLFIGSCGRPDLVGSLGHTADGMARMMFNSLRETLIKLPDDVKVFPGHGAGSPCGKSLSDALWSTIGDERKTNPSLQFDDVEKFVTFLTSGQPHSPQYFIHSVKQNLAGAEMLKQDVLSVPWLSAVECLQRLDDESALLDTRDASMYASGHLPGSINLPKGGAGGSVVQPHEGNFAIWVGTLVAQTKKIYIIATAGEELEALQRLARIGYKAHAVVIGGTQDWQADGLQLQSYQQLYIREDSVPDFLTSDSSVVVDVRTPDEYGANHWQTAISWPLADMHDLTPDDDKYRSRIHYCYCASGYRSSIAASCLARAGRTVVDLIAGFANLSVRYPQATATGQVCPVMRTTAKELEKMFTS